MPLQPISAIIPTLGRPDRLRRTLAALAAQSVVPTEIIVIDATAVPVEVAGLRTAIPALAAIPSLVVERPIQRGAAAQRNQGQARATQPYLLFLDDDVDPEPDCLEVLWTALQADAGLGGCAAMITNQYYHPPGPGLRLAYGVLGCPREGTLAGTCQGPALHFLPALDGRGARPGHQVDWMNLCFSLFRREAVPVPALLPHFKGYSLMEDAAMTLEIAKRWRLAADPRARIFHDTQPAGYKDRAYAREKMEVINRWFVMRVVLGRDSLLWDLRQFGYQLLMLLVPLRQPGAWPRLPRALAGKVAGLFTVLLHAHRWRGYMSGRLP